MKTCIKCGDIILSSRATKYCSRKCGLLYRDKHVYSGKFTTEYYSRTPLNFFRSTMQKKKHAREHLTAQMMNELWERQNGLCALTGRPMTIIKGQGRVLTNASMDRIDSKIGYELDNIQLTCLIANLMKQQLNLDELRDWCQAILAHTADAQ